MNEAIGRNDPCLCGSGKKYKHCCAGKARWTDGRIGGLRAPVFVGLVGAVIAVTIFFAFFGPGARRAAMPVGAGLPVAGTPPGGTPAPWTYDSTTNQHWDPAHGHWHQGPPPPEAARGAVSGGAPGLVPGARAPGIATPGATPAPYQYDPATNRHWDPDHGHWHDGPPPANAPR